MSGVLQHDRYDDNGKAFINLNMLLSYQYKLTLDTLRFVCYKSYGDFNLIGTSSEK